MTSMSVGHKSSSILLCTCVWLLRVICLGFTLGCCVLPTEAQMLIDTVWNWLSMSNLYRFAAFETLFTTFLAWFFGSFILILEHVIAKQKFAFDTVLTTVFFQSCSYIVPFLALDFITPKPYGFVDSWRYTEENRKFLYFHWDRLVC